MPHYQVRWDEISRRQAPGLSVDRGLDQRHAGQRRRVRKGDQGRSLDDLLDIHIHRIGNPFGVRLHDDHLAGSKDHRVSEPSVAGQTQASFQDEDLEVEPRDIFHHYGRPGDRSRDGGGVNLCAAQTLGDLEKHRSFFQRHVARSRLETEERLGSEAGESIVLKEQFRTGSFPRLQPEIVLDDVAD
jgi:hypothetical protein